jgi:hypothetical protein
MIPFSPEYYTITIHHLVLMSHKQKVLEPLVVCRLRGVLESLLVFHGEDILSTQCGICCQLLINTGFMQATIAH